MCKASRALHEREKEIRGDVEFYSRKDEDILNLHELARLAQVALELQKTRLDHEVRCPFCEAERVTA